MSTYAYTGYDTSGVGRKGWIEAVSAKRARLLLAEQGILTDSLHSVAENLAPSLPEASREVLFRELGALLKAGLPLEQALGVLMQGTDQALAPPAAALRERIREGGGFAAAWSSVCPGQSAFESAALSAAEMSGDLATAFVSLASVLGGRRRLREQLRTALTYPVFVCILGLLVAAGMSFFIAPRAIGILAELQGETPAGPAAMLLGLRILLLSGVSLLVLLFLLRPVVMGSLRRHPQGMASLEKRLFRVPGLRGILESLWSSRFASALAMLSRAGAQRVDSLAMAGEASGSVWVAMETAGQAVSVRQGAPLSHAVEAVAPLRRSLAEWTRIGETGGCLDELLDEAADRLQSEYRRRLERGMSLLEPVLILLIGAFVLVVALSVLLPLLTVSRAIAL